MASLRSRLRTARIIVAEAHPNGRTTLARACRCVATDVHVVATWRNFVEVIDHLDRLALPPDMVILGDPFSNRAECETMVRTRFPQARVFHLPARKDGGRIAARLLRHPLDRAA